MKLRNLIIAIGMFASTSVFANMDDKWNSPECVFTQEADEPELRAFALKTLLPGADKNQAMLIEDLSFKDTLVAVQQVVCEGTTPQEALEWVGL